MQATLRNIIAKITLDDTFSSRETINEELLEKVFPFPLFHVDPSGCGALGCHDYACRDPEHPPS